VPSKRADQYTIQDLYLDEYLMALKLAARVETVAQLVAGLEAELPQNSPETRRSYARRMVTLLFPSKTLDSAPVAAWRAYCDDRILRDHFRVRYLEAISLAREFLLQSVTSVGVGAFLPPDAAVTFVEKACGEVIPKAAERLPRNLAKLGFLRRSNGGYVRVVPPYDPTSVMLELYRRFGQQPATVSFQDIVADPFWRLIGVPDEAILSGILYTAVGQQMLAKFVTSDELHQVTMGYAYAELLEMRRRLA
jgi:hypothetical protein